MRGNSLLAQPAVESRNPHAAVVVVAGRVALRQVTARDASPHLPIASLGFQTNNKTNKHEHISTCQPLGSGPRPSLCYCQGKNAPKPG